jgi:hypothetical protein
LLKRKRAKAGPSISTWSAPAELRSWKSTTMSAMARIQKIQVAHVRRSPVSSSSPSMKMGQSRSRRSTVARPPIPAAAFRELDIVSFPSLLFRPAFRGPLRHFPVHR